MSFIICPLEHGCIKKGAVFEHMRPMNEQIARGFYLSRVIGRDMTLSPTLIRIIYV